MAGLFLPPSDSMTVNQSSTSTIPAEQRRLLGQQANQYQSLAPLSTAMELGKARGLGLQAPNPFAPALSKFKSQGIDPQDALGVVQNYSRGVYTGSPRDKDILLTLDAYGTTPDQLSNVLVRGAPSSSGTNLIASQLAAELQQALTQPEQQQTIYDTVSSSPLARAMQASFRLRPEELAIPGAVGQTSRSMADTLRGATADYTGRATGLADRARYLSELGIAPMDLAPGRAAYTEAAKPLDTASLVDPLTYAFSGENNPNSVMAQLRTAAIRAGHSPDVASSGYNKLLTGATREYGSGIASVLANAELQRRNALTQAAMGVTQGENAQAQNALRQMMTNLQGVQTAGGINADVYNAQAGQLAPLYQYLMAGPQAEAGLAGLQRQLAGQEAGVPLSLLQGTPVNVPGAPTYPGGEISSRQNQPTTGAQVGAGLNQALMMGVLGPTAFNNIAGMFGGQLFPSTFGAGQMVTGAGLGQEALGQGILAQILASQGAAGAGAGAATAAFI